MHLIPFVQLFPQQAEAETRVITTRNHAVLPDDEYALVEAYCPDPQCDCQRVMLNIVARRRQVEGFLASISFGFNRDQELAGPLLDPLNPQSQYADALLELIEVVLSDPNYCARLERHYHQVKQATADSTHPVHKMLARLERSERRLAKRRSRKRNKRRKKR